MRNGDYVRVWPEGDESKATVGRVILIDRGQQAIQVVFEGLPAFLTPEKGIIDSVTGRALLQATRPAAEGLWLQVGTDTPFLVTPAAVPCKCRYYIQRPWSGERIPSGHSHCVLTSRYDPCWLEAQGDLPDETLCYLAKERGARGGSLDVQVESGLPPGHSAT